MPTRANRRDRRQRALATLDPELDIDLPSRPLTARTFHRPTYLAKLAIWPYNPICLAPQSIYGSVHCFYKFGGTFELWNQHFEQLVAELYAISQPFDTRPDQDYLFFPTESCEVMMQYVKASIAVHTQLLLKLDGVWDKAMERWKGMEREERKRMLLNLFEKRRKAIELLDDLYDSRLALPEITLGNLVEDGAVLVELLDQLRPPSDVNLTKGISNEVCPNDDFDRLFGLNKFDASVLPKRRGLRTYLEWCRDLRLEGLLKFALSVLNTLDGRVQILDTTIEKLILENRSLNRRCASCLESPSHKLLLCSACRKVGRLVDYCSAECQLKHRPIHSEQERCGQASLEPDASVTSQQVSRRPKTPAENSLRSLCLELIMSCPDDLITLPICISRARPILIVSSPFDKTPEGESKLHALRSIVISAFSTGNRADVGLLILLTQGVPIDFGYRSAFGRLLVKAFPYLLYNEQVMIQWTNGSTLIDLFRLKLEERGRSDAQEICDALATLQTSTSSWEHSPIGDKLSAAFEDFDHLSPMQKELRNHLYNSDDLFYFPPLLPENEGTSISSPFEPGTLRYELSLNDLRELAYDAIENQSMFSVAILCWIISGGTRHDVYENEHGVELPIRAGFCKTMPIGSQETFRTEMYYQRERLLSSTDHSEGDGYINWEVIAQVLRVVDNDRDGTEDDDLPFPPLIGRNASSNRKKKQKQREKQARLALEVNESKDVEKSGGEEEIEEKLVKGVSDLELEKRDG